MKEIKAKEAMYLTQVKEVEGRNFVKTIKSISINEADWWMRHCKRKKSMNN